MDQSYRPPSRRDFLRIGGLSALGLGLTDFMQLRAQAETLETKARSCILVWLDGGPSHLDSFDPKPDAPLEVRGPFAPISTAVPGVQLSELMPGTARILDRATLVRSVTSPLGEHNLGTHYMLTGFKPNPALEYPSLGSVVSHLRRIPSDLPGHTAIPDMRVGGGQFAPQGYLPSSAAPFEVGGDPGQPDFRIENLDPYAGITIERIERRREFLHSLDRVDRDHQANPPSVLNPAFEQAYRMMTSPDARTAFDLASEQPNVRQQYGPRSIGQSCLLARRLVERGVPFVTVNSAGWDTHTDMVTRLKDGYTGAQQPVGLLPSLDLAVSALLEDLSERGLLDDVLVVVMGEFGRTPKLNVAGGRDHWPRVFSVLLAGGGVPGGQVIGASDSHGESPLDRPVTPADLACTIFTLLGIDPATTLHTSDGRPVKISDHGVVISELVG
jgi:hypothetical protein